jgi:hypothetical protein
LQVKCRKVEEVMIKQILYSANIEKKIRIISIKLKSFLGIKWQGPPIYPTLNLAASFQREWGRGVLRDHSMFIGLAP